MITNDYTVEHKRNGQTIAYQSFYSDRDALAFYEERRKIMDAHRGRKRETVLFRYCGQLYAQDVKGDSA